MTNIASGTSAHTETVVSGGSIPRFIRLLDSPNLDVVEQAAWALGNISGDSVAFRDIILSSGALLHLSMISVSRISVLRNVTWAISNICRGKPSPAIDDLKVAFPFLLKQLTIDDIEVQVDACFAISYLSEGDNERITEVVQAGFLPPIVNILENTESATLRTAALRVIGNVLTGDEHPTQIVIDLGILPILYRLLDSPRKSITKEACWSISNITAGTLSQVQAVINADIIPKIIMLGNSSSQDISKECVWCLANALDKKNTEQTKYFVQQGVVSFLNRSLSIPDVRSMTVTLTAIKSIVQTDESFHQVLVDTLGLQLQGLNTTDNLENSNLIGQILSDLKCPLPNL